MSLFIDIAAIQHASDRVISGASDKYIVGSDGLQRGSREAQRASNMSSV
jgi:hypothetical protein